MNSELQEDILEEVKDKGTRGLSRSNLFELFEQNADHDVLVEAIADLETRNKLFRNPDGRYTFSKNRFE